MITIITSIISFVSGFFIKKKIAEVKELKKEVKQYENQQKQQQEIIARNIDNDISDPVLQFKKNREQYKASK